MRSLNNNSFQTNQKHPYFASASTDNRLSPLVSQYMDMFDTTKVNTSLLQKRERPSVDDFLQSELQKKVKTLMGARDCQPVAPIPNLAAMLFNQNLSLNTPFQSLPIRNLQQQSNLIRQQQQQQEVIQLLQSQLLKKPPTMNHFQPTLITNNQRLLFSTEVKEEHVDPIMKETSVISTMKGKASDIMSENNTTNDGLSEYSGDKDDFEMPSPRRDEPVLTEFTKAFPDWDLTTIFSFLKSGKSMDAFEKERKFKMERKLKKQKTEKKSVNTNQNKNKKTNVF